MVPQELEQVLRFLDFVTDDSPGKPLINIKRFLTRHWVLANDRVLWVAVSIANSNIILEERDGSCKAHLSLDWFPPNGSSLVT
jgi:hypothetical protein